MSRSVSRCYTSISSTAAWLMRPANTLCRDVRGWPRSTPRWDRPNRAGRGDFFIALCTSEVIIAEAVYAVTGRVRPAMPQELPIYSQYRMTRRQLLRAGLGLGAFVLPGSLTAVGPPARPRRKAKSVIVVLLEGG